MRPFPSRQMQDGSFRPSLIADCQFIILSR
jgi:hypothetical protein